MSLAVKLATYFSAKIRERGLELYRARAVKIAPFQNGVIHAVVRGSADYDVSCTLKDGKLLAACSCPYLLDYAAPCKHLWAVCLTADAYQFDSGAGSLKLILKDFHDEDAEDDWDEAEGDGYAPPPPRQVRPVPKPVVPTPKWRTQWDALRQQVGIGYRSIQRAGEWQLILIVDVNGSKLHGALDVEVNSRERKLNGDWGKPKTLSISKQDAEGLPDPIDRRMLSLLDGAESASTYHHYGARRYRIKGPLLDELLPLAAKAERLYLRQNPMYPTELLPLVADFEPKWESVLSLAPGKDAKTLGLTGLLRRGSETLHLSQISVIVPGAVVWNNRIGRLNADGAVRWLQALLQLGPIPVPALHADEMLAELLAMPNVPQLELPETLGYSEIKGTPRPLLTIRPSNNPRNQTLPVELAFDYGSKIVPAKPAGRGLFFPDGRQFLLRDAAIEAAADQALTRLGVRPMRSDDPNASLEIKSTLLPKLVRELVALDWKVEAEGKAYRSAGTFALAVRSNTDWFDLEASADFDGHAVSFPRLLEALRQGNTTVVLDDGSIGVVPEDWLRKYGLLARIGTVEGDRVRFGRGQVGVLDALLASRPEVTFDEQFAHARSELRKFEGVAAADPPTAFVGALRAYQREGLGWLRFLRQFGVGGCLADDMGLGKTVQVLALLAEKRERPTLIVLPKSLVFNWKREAAHFTPHLKVLEHVGSTRDRTGAQFNAYDLILTTYGTLRNDATMLADIRFDTCVLDESQAAKNATTETAKAVRIIQADHRLALSGTPVENHLGELVTLFHFLNPGMLGRTLPLAAGAGADPEMAEILAKALRPFILRRTKDQVAKDLPEKTEQTVYCDLEPTQQKLYNELRDHYRSTLLGHVDQFGLNKSKMHVLEALLRLRQAACHPGLIDKNRTSEPSAKLDMLLPQLRELAEGGKKTLVFSQFTSLLAILRTRLDAENVAYEYLDGKTRDRADRVERFQKDPNCRLFLVSLKAGGVGLNLTAAEYVFLLDPWWNPAVEAQAIDRSHRIGQTKPVFAYRLIARGTVEEKVLELQRSKRALADAILGGGNVIADLKREDLEMLLS